MEYRHQRLYTPAATDNDLLTMSKRANTFHPIRDRIRDLFKRGTSPGLSASSTPAAAPSNSGGAFGLLVGGVDAPQPFAQDMGNIAYEGFKGLLAVLDKVGYALPPLKATASGLSSVMAMIDVRNS
jgi:hypothetical protein